MADSHHSIGVRCLSLLLVLLLLLLLPLTTLAGAFLIIRGLSTPLIVLPCPPHLAILPFGQPQIHTKFSHGYNKASTCLIALFAILLLLLGFAG